MTTFGRAEAADTGTGLGRLEAFSDGVFAIAITLLILDVRVEPDGGGLASRLAAAWPSYLAYVISFTMIGIMWLNHHQIMQLVRTGGHSLQVTNLVLLLLVTTVPFPTRVVADALTHGELADQRTAAILYALTFAVIGAGFAGLWLTIVYRRRLLRDEVSPAQARRRTRRVLFGTPSFTLAAVVALWSPSLSVGLDAVLALAYLLPSSGFDRRSTQG